MASSTYNLIRQAMQNRQQIVCTYNNLHRELCVHTLGTSSGREMALAYQFAGDSNSPPKSDNDRWRCLEVSKLQNVSAREGAWYTAGNHSRPQTCVKVIDLEVQP